MHQAKAKGELVPIGVPPVMMESKELAAALIAGIFPMPMDAGHLAEAMGNEFLSAATWAGFLSAATGAGIFPMLADAGHLAEAMGNEFLSAATGAGFLSAATGAGFLSAVQDTGSRPLVAGAVVGSMLMHLRSGPPLVHEDHDTQLLDEGILVRLATCWLQSSLKL